MKTEIKVNQYEDDWFAGLQTDDGWVLTVDDDVASRWDYTTKQFLKMQDEIENQFEEQNPLHQ